MKINVKIDGLAATRSFLGGLGKQVRFATARALTQTAYAVRKDNQDELKRDIAGGATPYTLRAFNVEAATRDTLQAAVYLRTDAPSGGTNYSSVLGHLYSGGNRRWKKLEGWLRGRGLLPEGMMIAPGGKLPLDARGNIRQRNLKEMLGILGSQTRNLQEYRRSGRGKQLKGIGYFVSRPGDKSGLPPGVWRRISTGSSSVVEPWIMYIRPVAYRQKFDLEKIAKRTVDRVFKTNFDKSLADALRTAK